MNISVGRTVKIVCSSSVSPVLSSVRGCSRAMRVCSVSTGAPQFEQKRTLGVTYAPQTEQVIYFSLSGSGEISRFSLIQNEAATIKGFASFDCDLWIIDGRTSGRRPWGGGAIKTLRS